MFRLFYIVQVAALLLLTMPPPLLHAEDAVRLVEAFPPGYRFHVSCRVELSGSLTLPLEKGQASRQILTIGGTSAIEYDERVLSQDADGVVKKTARIYRRIDFQRKVGDRLQENTVRPSVRRLMVLRRNNVEVPFSPDGPLTWGEIDLVRTDVFTPALAGLLTDKEAHAGSKWTAASSAVQELTDMVKIQSGSVVCTFEQIAKLGSRRYARVGFSGTVTGVNEDGPNRQQLQGYLFFDLESRHLGYLFLRGVSYLLDRDNKEQGKVVGQLTLTRRLRPSCKELSDEALRGVALEPNADNTLLLFDNPDEGVKFLYPRRWHVAGIKGRQVALDEADGSGLLITLEPPDQAPTAAQFLLESQAFLNQQKVKVTRVDRPSRLQPAAAALDHFALETEQGGQRVLMDYYVTRQERGGAALAARLLPADLQALRKEVERIARSLRITRAIAMPAIPK